MFIFIFQLFFYINFDLGRNNQVKRTRKLLGGVTREPIPEGITEIPMEGKPCKKNPEGRTQRTHGRKTM